MLISQAITNANALTGQVVDNATLVRWLSELDGRLAFEFYRADAWMPYDPTDDLSSELLVPFPWDGLYIHHLAAQTYFANGEYDRYENERVMSEKTLGDFRAFMQRTQSRKCGCPGFPTEKTGGTAVTVIPGVEYHGPWFWLSAYALAVKHGYKGTEEEWINSVAGPNVISDSTVTEMTGVLVGNGSTVGAKSIDTSSLTNDNNHIPTSSVVNSALYKPPITIITAETIGIAGITASYIRAGIAFLKIYDLKPASSSESLGTLPVSLKPNASVHGIVISANGTKLMHVDISAAGVFGYTNGDTSTYYYGTLIYPVA